MEFSRTRHNLENVGFTDYGITRIEHDLIQNVADRFGVSSYHVEEDYLESSLEPDGKEKQLQ